MLVNLSAKPRTQSKDERFLRGVLKNAHHDKYDFRSYVKQAMKFKGFNRFEKYHPLGGEFVEDSESKFDGCYFLRHSAGSDELVINAMTKQRVINFDFDSEEYWDCYGLCDNASQVIRFYNQRKSEGKYPGNHVIILSPMNDFRWHKWGQYIGEFTPSREYFSDEEGIEFVYSFKIYHVA